MVNVLRLRYGSVNFTQICKRMLEYGCKIPYASKCILLTERTVAIRFPVTIYKMALSVKCYIDVNYNVSYGKVSDGINIGYRNKPFSGGNNLCQGLYTTDK